MPSSTVENYLKQLYLEQQRSPDDLVAMGKLANLMGVVPGTATTMIKALSDSGLVFYEPRGGVRLTPGGEQLALHVLRRHRLVELFLVRVLGLDWSEVHDEAEELEHAISDKVLERIDAVLEHPRVDPHGDPIPTAKGDLHEMPVLNLNTCLIGRRVRIARVMDQATSFLQFLDRVGLMPGTHVTVTHRDEAAEAVTLQADSQPSLTLGAAAAAKVLVEEV